MYTGCKLAKLMAPPTKQYHDTIAELLNAWKAHEGLAAPPPKAIKLHESESVTVYVDNTWGPPLGYGAIDHRDGHKNHGYIRIKGDPAGASRIPEAQGWPEIAEFINLANAGPLETVGCEKHFFPETIGNATIRLGSYFNLIFSDFQLNDDPKNHLVLAAALSQPVKKCCDWWGSVEIALERMKYIPHTQSPWGTMLRVSNRGRNEAEARKLWGITLQRLGGTFSRLPLQFPH